MEMSRKYRAKDKKGHWHFGWYVYHYPVSICFREDYHESRDEHYIIEEGFSDWNLPRGMEMYPIEPETVGQYTGLTDCKRRMIYEGDIVRVHSKGFDVSEDKIVKFFNGCFVCMDIKCGICVDLGMIADKMGMGDGSMEVIGNIHDNPELMEKKK